MAMAKNSLSGAIFSLLVIGCGAHKSGKSTDFVAAPPSNDLIQFKDSSGVQDCPSREGEVIKMGETMVQMTIAIPGKAQRVIQRSCKGNEQKIFSQFHPVSFILPAPQQDVNMVEVRNLTTCTWRNQVQVGIVRAHGFKPHGNGPEHATAFREYNEIEILPAGQRVDDPPDDLVLDPSRLNVLKVSYKKCEKLKRVGRRYRCEGYSTNPEEYKILLTVTHSGQHERDHQVREGRRCGP